MGNILSTDMKALAYTIPNRRWRALRLVLTSLAMLCVAVTQIGLTQDGDGSQLAAVPATRQADKVVVLPIRTEIDRFTLHDLKSRIERAQRENAQAIVIELDTPGGEVGAVWEITSLLKGGSTPSTVAWINDTALSGGAIIAVACDEIVTNDPAQLGDAPVIMVSPISGLVQMDEQTRQKFMAPLLTDLVDSARRNGYDEKVVQGFTSLGVELWLVERASPGPNGEPVGERLFVDLAEYRLLFGEPPEGRRATIPSAGGGSAPLDADVPIVPPPDPSDPTAFRPAAPGLSRFDEQGAISGGLTETSRPILSEADRGQWKVVEYVSDGKAPITLTSDQLVRYGFATDVIRTDEELKAYFGASTLVRWEESGWMAVARFMSNPVIQGILLVIVLVGFFIEMASPGLGVFGAIAFLALIGFFAPAVVVGMAGWWEFAALGLGIVLVLVEVFLVPGLGVPGVIGAVLVFVGLLGTFTGGGGFQTQGELLTGVVVLLLSLASAGVIVFLFARNLGRIPGFNRLVLQSVPIDGDDENPSFFEAMAPTVAKPQLAVGALGEAVGVLRPSGRARFGDDLVDVVSVGPIIERGQAVRVVKSTAFSVVVEPADEPSGRVVAESRTPSTPEEEA